MSARGYCGAAALVVVLLPASAPGQFESVEDEHSILVDRQSRVRGLLQLLPSSGAYENLFELVFQPVSYSLEEIGGFTIADPQRMTIYGNSSLWTTWSFNDLDISDVFFSGAASLRVPYRFLSEVSIRFGEDPRSSSFEGPVLRSRAGENSGGLRFALSHTLPDAGGIIAPAVGIAGVLSETHPIERDIPPPRERRRFASHLSASAVHDAELESSYLKYGFEVHRGARRFLDFKLADGSLDHVFDEDFTIASASLELRPKSGAYRIYLLSEYDFRDHLFAEIHHAEAETAKYQSGALFLGVDWGDLAAGATLKYFEVQHNQLEFTRELVDPDGEALSPFYPDGKYFTANLDFSYLQPLFYVRANNRILSFVPGQEHWSNPLTFRQQPYGRIDWESRSAFEAFGQERIGLMDRADLWGTTLTYNVYFAGTYAVNASLTNSLFFPDLGAVGSIDFPLSDTVVPFFTLAKTPVPITSDLVRRLDPAYLNGRQFLAARRSGGDGGPERLIDTTGGSSMTVAPSLSPTNIYSVAAGVRLEPWRRWRLELQGLLRMYRNTYWVSFRDGADANGYFVRGRFFLRDGSHQYVLNNYPLHPLPMYLALQAQLFRIESERFVASVALSVSTAFGGTVFGNGVSANDIGVVDTSMANPNSAINAFSNLDSDRAFLLKALAGYQIAPGLWVFGTLRYKDGKPFAYYDYLESDGQVAISYASHKGSPLTSRPLIGPRGDFRLNIDAKVQYMFRAGGLKLSAAVTASNLLDLGSELSELFTDRGRRSRSALELEIPRSLIFDLEVGF